MVHTVELRFLSLHPGLLLLFAFLACINPRARKFDVTSRKERVGDVDHRTSKRLFTALLGLVAKRFQGVSAWLPESVEFVRYLPPGDMEAVARGSAFT
jgi:hypothetical protein